MAGGGTENLIGYVQDDWTLGEVQLMKGVVYEDLRLYVQDGELHAVGVDAGQGKLPRIVVLDLDNEGALVAAHPQTASRVEKNWMPVVTSEGLRLVYRTSPLTVLDYDQGAHAVKGELPPQTVPYAMGDGPRGGSQLVPYEGGYLAVVHERHAEQRYTHAFVRFDRDLARVSIGPPWTLEHDGIEFVCGLARHRNQWVVSYGFDDRSPRLALVSDQTVRQWTAPLPLRAHDLLVPKRIGLGKIRLGRDLDGGYIVPESVQVDALLSYGVRDDVSFERGFHARYPDAKILAFDPTVDGLPQDGDNTGIEFHQEGVCGPASTSKNYRTLSEHLDVFGRRPHLWLKADIEGDEYAALDVDDLAAFEVVVLELHDLGSPRCNPLLHRLAENFEVFHVHANNSAPLVGGLPSVVEATWVHRRVLAPVDHEPYPTTLDRPCMVGAAELPCDWWVSADF